MNKFIGLFAGALVLAGCGGGGGGSSSSGGSTGTVSGLNMPESMSVVVAQDSVGAQSLGIASVHDVSLFPTTAQYNTDKTNSYVYDESMESLDTVNMILCLLEQTRATDMVNQGAYIALVNEDKCEQGKNGNSGQSSTGQSSGGQATAYNSWTIQSARADTSSPQIVKIWVPGDSGGADPMDAQNILVEVTVTESVSDTSPFGKFSMNFKGVVDAGLMGGTAGVEMETMKGTLKTLDNDLGQPHFNFINVGGDAIDGGSVLGFSFVESSDVILDDVSGTGGVALTHRAITENQGGGGTFSAESTYAVAFNSSFLYRGKDDNGDGAIVSPEPTMCTDRNDFNTSVWRYNLYHTADGTFNGKTVTAGQRVALNSGFPFEYDSNSDGSNDAYGYIGYHGIWAEGGTLADGSTITQFDYANDTTKTHTVHISDGKLVRRTANSATLTELQGEEFQWWGMHPTLNIDGQWLVTVDTNNDFKVISTFSWGQNGPVTSTTIDHDKNPSTVEVDVTAVLALSDKQWMGFWSDSLGGNINYVHDVSVVAGNRIAKFFAQEFVNPNDAIFTGSSLTLYCYERCLKGGLTQQDITNATSENDLYNTYDNVNPLLYTLSVANGKMMLTDNSNADAAVSVVGLDLASLGHDWGIHTGEMVLTAITDPTMPWTVYDKPVTYSWETGNNDWNRMVTVTDSNGAFASFDPPMHFSYTHEAATNDANAVTTYDQKKFLLEYGGPGELRGFPWESTASGRWYAAVTLKDGVELTNGQGTFVVKAIEKEQSMKTVAESSCNTGVNALNLDTLFTTLSLPLVSDLGTVSFTLAEKPAVTTAPAVIEGELQ